MEKMSGTDHVISDEVLHDQGGKDLRTHNNTKNVFLRGLFTSSIETYFYDVLCTKWYKEGEDMEEDVRSYWMTLKIMEDIGP